MNKTYQERIKLTCSCNDCDALPKVENAGCIIEDNTRYQIMHNGLKVMLGGYHGEWMEEIISNLRGHHEPQEEKAFYEVMKYIPSGGTMIELGSYWAYYSMWFQLCVKNSVNYLVEPNNEKLTIGKKNFELNNMKGNFINASIGASSIKDNIFVDWDDTEIIVDQITIDKIIKNYQIEYVDILHSDIQGAEMDMLLGAKQALEAQKIHFLFISTHGYCHNKCIRTLNDFGYNVLCEHSIDESYSADGLIVAKSPFAQGPKNISISRLKSPLTRKALFRVKEVVHSLRSN